MTQQEKEKLFCELNESMALKRLKYNKRIQELTAQKQKLYRQIDEVKANIAVAMQGQQQLAAEFNRRKAEIISIVPEVPEDAETDYSQVRKLAKKISDDFIKILQQS